jgi:hypothetical protein
MIPMYVIVWGCIVYVTQHFQNTISPRWRARLRRVSLRGIGGPLGILLSGVGTVLDPLMIH